MSYFKIAENQKIDTQFGVQISSFFLTLANNPSKEYGRHGPVLGKEHSTLDSLEMEIAEIKRDLDTILAEARSHTKAGG